MITMEGNVLFSNQKAGVQPFLSVQDAEASVFRAAIRMGTRKEFLPQLGGINYAFADYGKVRQYTIPLDKEVKVLLVLSEDKNYRRSQRSVADGSPSNTLSVIDQIFGILTRYGLR